MTIYKSDDFKLSFSPEMVRYLKEHQRNFMPEDTKAGMIQAYLDRYTGSAVCSKQLFREALNQDFDEPKQWEIREINKIMNQCVTGWKYFPNPRIFEGYGAASKGVCPLNASPAPAPGSPDPDSSALFGAQRNPLCGTHRRYVICRNRGPLCRSGDEKTEPSYKRKRRGNRRNGNQSCVTRSS